MAGEIEGGATPDEIKEAEKLNAMVNEGKLSTNEAAHVEKDKTAEEVQGDVGDRNPLRETDWETKINRDIGVLYETSVRAFQRINKIESELNEGETLRGIAIESGKPGETIGYLYLLGRPDKEIITLKHPGTDTTYSFSRGDFIGMSVRLDEGVSIQIPRRGGWTLATADSGVPGACPGLEESRRPFICEPYESSSKTAQMQSVIDEVLSDRVHVLIEKKI